MVVIHTIAYLTPEMGGPSQTLPALCAALLPYGISTQIIALDGGEAFAKPVVPDTVPLILAPSRYSQHLRVAVGPDFQKMIEAEVERGQASILHDHAIWLPTHIAARRVALRRRLPFVVSPRGMLSPWALRQHRGRKMFAWLAYQKDYLKAATAFHAATTMEADDIRRLGFGQPIAVIPHGVAPPPAASPAAPLLETDGRPVLLFLARIHPQKGLPDLVKAMATLNRDDWLVVVAGPDEGGHRAEVESLVAAAGMDGQFVFPGPVHEEEKWRLFRQADLFVLPSYSESFGMVVAEALSCGVPVITTRATPWEDLETYKCGWWVETGVAPLVAALKEAFDLAESQRRAMGERGSELAAWKYTWGQAAGQMAGVYRWLLDGNSRPACLAA